MEWRSSYELEITDLGDRLEVLAKTKAGGLDYAYSVVITSVALYLFAKVNRTMAFLVAAIAVLGWLNSVRKGNETRLIVDCDGFLAEGNVDRTIAQQVMVGLEDIQGIGYFVGHEGGPNGLYALGRWRQTCLVPGIDEAACLRIQSAVDAKFPGMRFGQEPVSSLFGEGPEILALGLNQNNSAGMSGQPK